MKRMLFLLVGLLMLSACASPAAPTQAAPASDPVMAVATQSKDIVIASAKVEPARISNLSFTISALVKEIRVKQGDVIQAGQPLMILYTPDLEFSVIAAEQDYNARARAAELQKADRVKYVDPKTGRVSWYALPREVYDKALSVADKSKAAWDSALASLAQNTISAPFDGTVIDIAVSPGELVQVNQIVLTVADLKSLQITTTDLSEREIARVKVGQSVNVHIEALNITVTGKVVRIAPKAESVGGDVVFPVTIALDNPPDGLLWGMSAEVEIQTK